MKTAKRIFSSWTLLIIFFVVLFLMVYPWSIESKVFNPPRNILILMAIFGLIGAVVGGVLGGIIGLVGKLFKKNTFIPGLKYGAAIGFIGLLSIWYLFCLPAGFLLCFPPQ